MLNSFIEEIPGAPKDPQTDDPIKESPVPDEVPFPHEALEKAPP